MDPEQVLAAGGEPLRARWLERSLHDAFERSKEDSHDEHAFKLAAAQEMARDLAPPEAAGPDERVLALHFVCAHNSTTVWLARAGARLLPRDARETAQRFACRLMDITARLQGALARAAAGRRKAEETAERRALDRALRAREAERERLEGLAGGMERFLGGFPDLAPILRDPEAAAQLVAAARGETPEATAPDLAEATRHASGDPAPPPFSRQQRRALARRQRKAEAAAGGRGSPTA